MEPEPEPEVEPAVVPILRNKGSADRDRGADPDPEMEGQRVVWNEENLLQNEADRPEGGYMKIDEPDTPFEHTVQPVSDSESDEEAGEGPGASSNDGGTDHGVAGTSAPPAALAFSESSFAEAFEAKRHTVIQGVDDDGGCEADASEAADDECATVVPGAYGTAPGDAPERFSAMAAAESAKFKKERSAHYNEYEKMQEYKRKLAAGELTDEDY